MFVIVDGPLPDDPVFPVCLETSVGDNSGEELLSELPQAGYYVHYAVRKYFTSKKSQLEKKSSEMVAFTFVDVQDLGFSDIPPFYAEILARIRSLGHDLCDPSDALILRRKLVQPVGDKLILAMNYANSSAGIHHVYYLAQYYESVPCLGAFSIRSNDKIHLRTKIAFRLGKQ